MNDKGFTLLEVIICIVIFFAALGYIMNIVKLASCDFERPYKAEVIRTVGIFTGPVGSVIGYLDVGK
jgi:hypothetical protein